MNANTISVILREEAMRRADDEPLMKLLYKAASVCDDMRVDTAVKERLLNDWRRRVDNMPYTVERLSSSVAELHSIVQRIESAVVRTETAINMQRQSTREQVNGRDQRT